MKTTPKSPSSHGFNSAELLVIVAVMIILGAVLLPPAVAKSKQKAQQIRCVSNLKQIGLSFRAWPSYSSDKNPMAVSTNYGGTMEFNTGADTFRHFQVMSNEISNPKVLICPSDTRQAATNFIRLKNENVSYFVGLDVVSDTDPQMILDGDRNITGPNKPKDGILSVHPGDKISWTAEMHVNRGNVGLADGSVQAWSDAELQKGLQGSGNTTNAWRIALPE